jgi:hypothetical protein
MPAGIALAFMLNDQQVHLLVKLLFEFVNALGILTSENLVH